MEKREEILRLMVAHRRQLFGFTLSLVRNPELAEEVFQNVCVVICQKWEAFTPGTDFPAWARKIARFQVMAEFKRMKRRHALLPEEKLDALEAVWAEGGGEGDWEEKRRALRLCLDGLPERSRNVLAMRYSDGLDCGRIARLVGRTRQAVHSLLTRLRKGLLECVRGRLARETGL